MHPYTIDEIVITTSILEAVIVLKLTKNVVPTPFSPYFVFFSHRITRSPAARATFATNSSLNASARDVIVNRILSVCFPNWQL